MGKPGLELWPRSNTSNHRLGEYSRVTDDRFLSRREAIKVCGMGLLATPLATLPGCRALAEKSFNEPAGAPDEGTAEQLLDELQRAAFRFFWDESSPSTGPVKDPTLANGNE